MLADHTPDLSTAPERATAAGYTHLNQDGAVIRTDRVATVGSSGTDPWGSGKHKHHGGMSLSPERQAARPTLRCRRCAGTLRRRCGGSPG